MVLFVGGPLNGVCYEWTNPPDYYPHVTATGMVPYTRKDVSTSRADIVFAPVGMTETAILEAMNRM